VKPLAALLALALATAPDAVEVRPASYPEGPVWIDGTLYWAEMGADRVMAWSPGAEPRVFFAARGCGPTALARFRADEILVLCHVGGALVRLDGRGDLLGTIHEDKQGNRLRDPNDAAADGAGGVWFSDPGTFSAAARASGALYHLAPDGRLTRAATSLAYGNGVWVDAAHGRLLVSEHLARRVLAYPLADGRLGQAEVLFALDDLGLAPVDYPEAGPDGLEIAPDGSLWVAEYGAGRLLNWAEGQGLKATVAVPAPYVTNIAFGPDGLAAVTGSFVNDRPPLPGAIWVLPGAGLATDHLPKP
jgi:sugar lactone lactonase YvrE